MTDATSAEALAKEARARVATNKVELAQLETLVGGAMENEDFRGLREDTDLIDRLSATLTEVSRERDALAAFKAYVHERLDGAGIPTHPEGPHSAEGCRVGDRMDLLIGERDALRSAAERARQALGPFKEESVEWANKPDGYVPIGVFYSVGDLRAAATAHASLTAVLQKGNADE